MADRGQRHRLTLIKRSSITKQLFQDSEVQRLLFPQSKAGIVVLVSFPGVSEQEFRDVLRFGRPELVLELRSVPRFDIGSLTRRAVFDTFKRGNAQYVDITAEQMDSRDSDRIIERLRMLFASNTPRFERPIVILLSQVETDAAFVSSILDELSRFGARVREVYEVPRYINQPVRP